MEEFQQRYIADALEILQDLEADLFRIEQNFDDPELIDHLFRLMHTLKGSAGMFGFAKTEQLTHHLEHVYDNIRDGTRKADSQIIDVSLKSIDLLKDLLVPGELLSPQNQERYDRLFSEVRQLSDAKELASGTMPEMASQTQTPQSVHLTYIGFHPRHDLFERGINLTIADELAELGQLHVFFSPSNIPKLDDFDSFKLYFQWDYFLYTTQSVDDIEDIFLFYDDSEYTIVELDSSNLNAAFDKIKPVLHTGISRQQFVECCEHQINKTLQKTNTHPQTETAEQTPVEISNEPIAQGNQETIRVSAPKLDELINLVSELVTLNSRLELLVKNQENQDLRNTVRDVQKLSKRFRDNALELRLMPIKILSVKFQRLIRDLSHKLNKKIDFVAEGLDTELDKNIINKIENPLMHIIRNSMDHGIETAHERQAQGKPEHGMVRLIAFYSGAHVFIQVQDDGKGIDPEFIRQKAIERRLITTEQKIEKKDIFELIFAPGFSTAESLTQVSGRGVGMDVVKQEIVKLRGEIDIDSEIGMGTSITLKLPLTLSIIDTLRVIINRKLFLIPVSFIDICIISHGTEKQNICDQQTFEHQDELIPMICLRKELDFPLPQTNKQKAVIVDYQSKKYAFLVDEIKGEHQAVVKPLDGYHENQHLFSGATIMGDGSLALILDVGNIIRHKLEAKNRFNFKGAE